MAGLKGFSGVWTAIITPFDTEGRVDWQGLERNINFQIASGVSGILAVGTTGESPTLAWSEHTKIITFMASLVRDRCGIMAGTGSNSTTEATAATKIAQKRGIRTVLLVDCYYNCPSSLELRKEYYGYIANAFPEMDIIPYIIPGRTVTALSPEDLAILTAEYPNIRAVKEASGDLERMIKTRQLVGSEFDILSGDDDLTYEMIARPGIAASGAISVMANVVPGAIIEMVQKMLAGNIKRGEELYKILAPLFEIVTVRVEGKRNISGKTFVVVDKFRNPVPVKTLMNGLGMSAGSTRRPLGKMNAAAVEVVRQRARAIWEKNPEILRPIEAAYGVDINERLKRNDCWETQAY
ncbi:4-hydroxy-tetrahydrodipicolinate synthase [candidate division NPL-UPA2 bacterium Unc8]|uniref:4-hydroxy-tetrahydrodipicolinate synthase n=1 Tax=candidate division NPL-UPA2 bacterium Unc8 TaxID=1980939 RepID=A0A399FVH5_UNCN2|nr:4-hydroxy-tetrahydrodipicolinate synthase [Bacillota bacterium]RIH99475.1 MAG: 4-hydroxy-tetrahydrodipicolinate synthase [candidate division NPL-UPA2 bacterium Unc8]